MDMENTSLINASDSPTEMSVKLNNMLQHMKLTQTFFKQAMKKDQDYGVIPGTDKPTLLKAGAEKLNELYGYSAVLKNISEQKDYETGFYEAVVTVQLISKKTGEIVAEGVGCANTYESRYRYRWVFANQLPKGIDKDSLKSETKQGKSGEYTRYRIENDNLFDLWNTVLKMAKKRAYVDVTLSATRSSGIFTQDMEDFKDYAGDTEPSSTAKSSSNSSEKFYCEGKNGECKDELTQQVASYSKQNYGQRLCRDCQKSATKLGQASQ